MICFVDLDGILTDFVGAVEKKFGIKIEEWEFDDKIPGISKDQFWSTCDRRFWAGLPWTCDGREILAVVEGYFGRDNIFLCTTPCLTDGCVEGKISWIQKNLPAYKRRYVITPHKEVCAHKGSVLIDDRDENIDKFIRCGGKGILIPRRWNGLSGQVDRMFSAPIYISYSLKDLVDEKEVILPYE